MDEYDQLANQMSGSVGDVTIVDPRLYQPGQSGFGGQMAPQGVALPPSGVSGAHIVGAPATHVPPAQAIAHEKQLAYTNELYTAGGGSRMGLGRHLIPAETANRPIKVDTQRPFLPYFLSCPSTVTGLLLNTVSIEGTNMFASKLGVPIESFSEVATNNERFQWTTINPSTGIEFEVTNPTSRELAFVGVLIGIMLRK